MLIRALTDHLIPSVVPGGGRFEMERAVTGQAEGTNPSSGPRALPVSHDGGRRRTDGARDHTLENKVQL